MRKKIAFTGRQNAENVDCETHKKLVHKLTITISHAYTKH
jgi:hypothetical protein